jgi:Domain of unknown function (DUF4287)/Domain of unknown function (DUF5655)
MDRREGISLHAYLDRVLEQTGKTPADFAELAAKAGLTRHTELVVWLKTEFVLGQGPASALAAVLLRSAGRKATPEVKLAALFSGRKARWRPCCDRIVAGVGQFGPDAVAAADERCVNLRRGKMMFALVQPSSGERLDLGLTLKGVAPDGRLEAAGTWNARVSHRVRVSDPREVDAQVLGWLREAYDLLR